MIRTKVAKKLLSKSEQKHLTESGINSMAALARQKEFMSQERNKDFSCFECRHIISKLIG